MNKNLKIFVPKDFLENKNTTSYEVMVYCALKASLPMHGCEEVYINLDIISLTLFGTTDISQNIRTEISNALNSLISKQIINPIVRKGNYWILKRSELTLEANSYFSVLYFDELRKLTLSDEKIKARLLKYFLNLIGTINPSLEVKCGTIAKKNVVGNMTQEYIAEISNISPSAVVKYNRYLERLKLVYVYRSPEIFLTKNGFAQATNVYGRHKDKDFINAFASKSDIELQRERNEKLYASDNGRRLAQMYTWLCRGKQYSEPEITEIYKYILSHNEKIQRLYEQRGNEDCLKELKDTSIFKQFDFLITELS